MNAISWVRRLFTSPVPECDRQRYAATERALEEAKGELRGTMQDTQVNTRRLRLMERTMKLKESYDGASGR